MKSSRWLILVGLVAAVVAAQEDPYRALQQYDWQHRDGIAVIRQQVAAAGEDAAKLAAIEAKLIPLVTAKETTPAGYRETCRFLSILGTSKSVPVLASKLTDPAGGDMARYALERMADPAAGRALAKALSQVQGELLVGVINSLGARREAGAVDGLKPLLNDPKVGSAAAAALGQIGTPAALAALQTAKQPPADTAEAILAAAERLVSAGDTKAAAQAYQQLAQPASSSLARAAALRGLVALQSPEALNLVVAALGTDDQRLQLAAARLAVRLADPQATGQFLQVYPKLSAPVQVVLLTALTDRGDAAAGDLAVAELKSQSPDVRAVAVRAAAVLQGVKAIAPLCDLAANGDRGDQGRARDELQRLPGAGVAAALIDVAGQADPPLRVEAIGILAGRGMAAAVPLLKQLSASAETKVAIAAWRGLAKLAPASDNAELVKALLAATDVGIRNAAVEAVIATGKRAATASEGAAASLAAYEAASAEHKQTLLLALAAIGGDDALGVLSAAARGTDAELQKAAVSALSKSWDGPAALPLLLELAQSQASTSVRVLALRGYVRLLGQDAKLKPEDKVAKLAAILPAAPRVEEQRLVLAALRDLRVDAAGALAASFLDNEQLREAAEEVILDLYSPQQRDNRNLPGVKGPETRAAVAKVQRLRGAGLPEPWLGEDLGRVEKPGGAKCADGTWTIQASGSDLWGRADGGYLVSRNASGDVTVTAHVSRVSETNSWTKAGVMLRPSAEAGAPNVLMAISAANGSTFQCRAEAGKDTVSQKKGGVKAPSWVKLTRVGEVCTGFISADGQTWEQVGQATVKLGQDILVCLALSSHDAKKLAEAVYDHVELSR